MDNAKLSIVIIRVKAKVKNPKAIEVMAAADPHLEKKGRSPSNMGMATGPTSAPNHETISPRTPPKCSCCDARIIVNNVKVKVVILAMRNETPDFFNFDDNIGRISRVITADMVLISEEVIDIVFANSDARTRPTSPTGNSSSVSNPYDCVGSARSGSRIGAAHIGKKRIRGQTRYKAPER